MKSELLYYVQEVCIEELGQAHSGMLFTGDQITWSMLDVALK
jgi:hypothetical protein